MNILPLNILFVHNKYRFAGGEDSVVSNESQLLKAHGHSVTIYEKDNTLLENYSLLKKLFLPFQTVYSVSSAREINRIIKEKHIDIVHVHNTLPLISFSVYYAAKKNGCALVQTLHNFRLLCPNGIFYRNERICTECLKNLSHSVKHSCYRNSRLQTIIVTLTLWFHRRLGTFQMPDAYIALTEFNKNLISDLIAPHKLYTKPNFTSTPPSFTVKKSRDYFIYASRLDNSKGIWILLRAFLNLRDMKLIIIGTGPEESSVRQFVKKHSMNHVEIKGLTPHQELITYLYHAKALLFPTQWYEGFPVILAESLSVGTPIIGSNIGNTSVIVKHKKTGLLFQPDSPQDLAEKIKMYNESPCFLEMEKNCLSDFQSNYSAEQNYKQLISIYEKVIPKNHKNL